PAERGGGEDGGALRAGDIADERAGEARGAAGDVARDIAGERSAEGATDRAGEGGRGERRLERVVAIELVEGGEDGIRRGDGASAGDKPGERLARDGRRRDGGG